MKRREFLQLSSLAGLTLLAPGTMWAMEKTHGRTLVLVELKGGNDGLNTVVPFEDPTYKRLRPNLALSKSEVIRLDKGPYLNATLNPLRPLWDEGHLAVVEGVGYPNPNRSHFRSIEIWETASDSNEYLHDGWLSSALPDGVGPLPGAMIAGAGEDGPLRGVSALTVESPQQLFRHGQRLRRVDVKTENPALAHVIQTQNDLVGSIASIQERVGPSKSPNGDFTKSSLGRGLQMTAQMLGAGVPLTVVKVQLSGFDTHAQQPKKHSRLLTDVGQNLAAFAKSLQTYGRWNEVVVATYSEFGRRVKENAGRGTDHGTAAPLFVLGGTVKGGVFGETPSLTDLDAGDLKFTTDYRRVYATLSKRWLGGESLGHQPLSFL